MQALINLFYKPFYSKQYYYDVVNHWKGKNLLLLLLMTGVVLIPTVFEVTEDVSRFIDTQGSFYIEQAPEFRIKDGTMIINKALPYEIKTKDDKTVVTFTDDSRAKEVSPNVPIVITTHKIIVKKSGTETQTYDLAQLNGIMVKKGDLYYWSGYMKLLGIFAYPFMVAGLFFYHLLISLVVFLVGLSFVRVLRSSMHKEGLYRLVIVAILPMIYCTTILQFAEIQVPGLLFISLLISSAYVVYGIHANNTLRGH